MLLKSSSEIWRPFRLRDFAKFLSSTHPFQFSDILWPFKFFISSTTVSLPYPTNNFKTIGQSKNMSWMNEVWGYLKMGCGRKSYFATTPSINCYRFRKCFTYDLFRVETLFFQCHHPAVDIDYKLDYIVAFATEKQQGSRGFKQAWWRHQMEKKIPWYWPFVPGIHRSPVNSPHKDQWRGALMFSLICTWINSWVNNR